MDERTSRVVLWTLFSAILFCNYPGCGGNDWETYPVNGRVTFPDGKHLNGGTVEFQPVGEGAGKFSARGRIQPDGTYQMSTFEEADGAIAGEHRVLVVPGLPPGPIVPGRRPKPVIHARYLSYETSGLKYTVTEDGPNTFDITVDRP